MENEQIQKILSTCGGWGWKETTFHQKREPTERVVFCDIDMKKLLKNKVKLNLPDLTKKYYKGEVSLNSEDNRLKIYTTTKCKIVGYETKTIPAINEPERIEKVPIYDCNGNGGE